MEDRAQKRTRTRAILAAAIIELPLVVSAVLWAVTRDPEWSTYDISVFAGLAVLSGLPVTTALLLFGKRRES